MAFEENNCIILRVKNKIKLWCVDMGFTRRIISKIIEREKSGTEDSQYSRVIHSAIVFVWFFIWLGCLSFWSFPKSSNITGFAVKINGECLLKSKKDEEFLYIYSTIFFPVRLSLLLRRYILPGMILMWFPSISAVAKMTNFESGYQMNCL